ncbi:MAG: LLM class flavin-dependent oxidoreductase [Acidimicrobiales bacterium]|nr:LLM class flavin-dependent oxidoreductase [Acidimicrobiales bacterium]
MAEIGAMIRRDVPPEHVGIHAASLAPVFNELWVVEDVPYAGGVSQLAEVLRHTDECIVGHGIAPAPFRNPMALAMEWATLARVYPGRLRCGIGHGVQTWMADIGERVASPLVLLEETAVAVQALLHGEDPKLTGRYRQISGWELEFPPDQVPGLSLGAVGPKTLALSGRIADGTIIPEGHGPDHVERAVEIIAEARAAAGRTDPHRLTLFVGFFYGPDNDRPPPPSEEMIQGWEITGDSPSRVADRIGELLETEVDSIVLVPYGDPQAQLELVATDVLPQLG